MPGGAPLTKRSSRPCKYGPRDEEGRCPKAPKKAKATSSPKPKPPCKYGPRTADGKCPKKPKAPKSEKQPTVRQLKSVDGAARQAGEVLRSKKATSTQKKEAVKVLTTAVAGEVGKKVAEHTYREAKKAVRQNKDTLKSAAKSAAKAAAGSAAVRAGVYGAAAAGVVAAGGAALSAQRRKEAKAFADRELAKTRKKVKLTDAQASTLWQQYYDFKLKQPVTNSFVGK